jgi:predicted CoA-binding protein
MKEAVLVIGASKNPDRYSYKAIELLNTYGHKTVGVSPTENEVLGQPCFKKILEIPETMRHFDTVTVYVNPKIFTSMVQEIINLKPKRVIFNPGTEAPEFYQEFQNAGIQTEEACTLVLLRTGQY